MVLHHQPKGLDPPAFCRILSAECNFFYLPLPAAAQNVPQMALLGDMNPPSHPNCTRRKLQLCSWKENWQKSFHCMWKSITGSKPRSTKPRRLPFTASPKGTQFDDQPNYTMIHTAYEHSQKVPSQPNGTKGLLLKKMSAHYINLMW